MTRVGPPVALALLDAADEANDGDAGDGVLLVPSVETLARVLARLGLELRRAVAELDTSSWPQGQGFG